MNRSIILSYDDIINLISLLLAWQIFDLQRVAGSRQLYWLPFGVKSRRLEMHRVAWTCPPQVAASRQPSWLLGEEQKVAAQVVNYLY